MFKFDFDTSNSGDNKQNDPDDDVELIASEEIFPDDKVGGKPCNGSVTFSTFILNPKSFVLYRSMILHGMLLL